MDYGFLGGGISSVDVCLLELSFKLNRGGSVVSESEDCVEWSYL